MKTSLGAQPFIILACLLTCKSISFPYENSCIITRFKQGEINDSKMAYWISLFAGPNLRVAWKTFFILTICIQKLLKSYRKNAKFSIGGIYRSKGFNYRSRIKLLSAGKCIQLIGFKEQITNLSHFRRIRIRDI